MYQLAEMFVHYRVQIWDACMFMFLLHESFNLLDILQICVDVHNHPVTEPLMDVQEMVIVSPSPVTVDTVLLVTGLEDVLLVVFGQEVSQRVNQVSQ